MQNKSFDAIKKPNNACLIERAAVRKPKVLWVDGIVSRPAIRPVKIAALPDKPGFIVPFRPFAGVLLKLRLPMAAGMAALLLAFGAGMWAALNTPKSAADSQPQVLGAQTSQPAARNYAVPLAVQGALGPVSSVPNEVLFSMTIDQLENYLTEALKTPEVREAEVLAERKLKLKVYLEEKNSPLAQIVDTLAELKHWKIVLAVSNSESSLGKRCYNNNCSGIGVEPGHPLWRAYDSKAEWAKDLDKLLERRYKDWTLEKMNGVYNQPGSKNWLLASKQILEDLQERGVE